MFIRLIIKWKVLALIVLSVLMIQTPSYSQEEKPFKVWLNELKDEAENRGFSKKSIDSAFSGIKKPVKRIISNDRNQAEAVESYAEYLNRRVNDWRIIKGKKLIKKHQKLLKKIANEYGVQARFIVAIWGIETNYGTTRIKEPVFSILATLAYDKRRAVFFRAQFFYALTMLDKGFIPYKKMKSSWAGAMGQCQFLPENYLRYAVDYNKDGKKDIWNTKADVFASIANYLSSFGWKDDESWGRPVLLPDIPKKDLFTASPKDLAPIKQCKRYKGIGVWRDLQEWQKLGVRRLNGSDLPGRSIPAALIVADPGNNKGFIIYRDFCTIMRFNPAFKYALAVGLLADSLKGDVL